MSKKLKIGLISLYVIENNGVRSLASSLRSKGYEVTEVYFKDYVHHHFVTPSKKEKDLLLDLLRARDIGLIGISLRAGAYLPLCVEVTRRIREELGVQVMWGGPHVSMAPNSCLDDADFIVVGEAEKAVCDVAEAMAQAEDVSTISNVWMKRDGKVVKNELRPLCQDLDEIPFRDFHSHGSKFLIRNGRVYQGDPMIHERTYLMISSRGCAYNCNFCDVNAFRKLYENEGKFFRYRSVSNCIEELEYAKRTFKKLKRIRFDDELFVPDKDWITEFAQIYPRRIGLPFEILSDPRCLDEWTIETLQKAGMDKVLVGIQGASSVNRRLYNRPVADEQVIEMARALKRQGVLGVFQVIVDDPETTLLEKEQLLDVLLALPKPFDLITFSLCHWPGTQRTSDLLEKGLISTDEVEGQNAKVLRQFLADFSYPRSPEDTFFLALYEMANKRCMPRYVVRRLAKSECLKHRPGPVVALAKVTNLAKLFINGLRMLLRGEVSLNMVRRWIHIFSSPSI